MAADPRRDRRSGWRGPGPATFRSGASPRKASGVPGLAELTRAGQTLFLFYVASGVRSTYSPGISRALRIESEGATHPDSSEMLPKSVAGSPEKQETKSDPDPPTIPHDPPKLPENGDESPPSGARSVGQLQWSERASQQSNKDQHFSLRNLWSSSTSSRISLGSCARCHWHSRRPASSRSSSGAAARTALIA
jgi:hypothetical protein